MHNPAISYQDNLLLLSLSSIYLSNIVTLYIEIGLNGEKINTSPLSLCHLATGCRWNAHFRLMGTWMCQVSHVKACLNQIKMYGYKFSTQSIITCSCHLWWNRWHFQRWQMCHLREEEKTDIEETSRTRWERETDRERRDRFIYLFLWPLKARRPPELFAPQWLPYCSFPVGRPFLFKWQHVWKRCQHITIVYTGHQMACYECSWIRAQSPCVIKMKIFGKAGRTRFSRLLLYLFSS